MFRIAGKLLDQFFSSSRTQNQLTNAVKLSMYVYSLYYT